MKKKFQIFKTFLKTFFLQYISTHLNFLRYVLQAGDLYLPWSRARDIWTTLVANPKACEWDREVIQAHYSLHFMFTVSSFF